MHAQATELPKDVTARSHPMGWIVISQGRLHYSWNDLESKITVWMQGEGGITDQWVLNYTIYKEYITSHPLCYHLKGESWFSILAFDPTLNVVFFGNLMELIRYDPCTQRLEIICALKSGTFIANAEYQVL